MTMTILDDVKALLGEALGLPQASLGWQRDTPLLGNVAELDSAAVIHIIASLEERYGIQFDDEDIDASLFETVGSLVAFVEGKLS